MPLVFFENTGQAPARIENGTITFSSGNLNFIKVLRNPTLPYIVPGTTVDTLEFSIVAASTVTGDLQVDADVSGFDVNTLSPVSANAIDSILVQTGANPSWLSGSTIPLVIDTPTSTDFRLSIINNGEADIELDSTRTRFIISGTPYTNFLLSGASPNVISGNDTTQLIFRELFIDSLPAADYTIQVNLVGTSNTSFYDNTINAGQVTIGGDIYFVGGEVTPSNVLLGQQGVVVEMIIGNQSSRLGIDNVGTTLTFERDGVPLPTPPTLTRTDALDTLEQIGDNRLYFTFDVPAGYPVDTIYVNGQISLDGGTIVKTSLTPIDYFVVSTGAKLEYIANSVTVNNIPNPQVIPRQTDAIFRVSVVDTGSSNLTLIKDSTYIEVGFTPEIIRTATSNFILNAGDTTLIDFVPLSIPASIPTDADYSMTLRIAGIEVNGDTLIDTLTVEDLRVLSPANMIVTATDIVPLVVRQGQTDIDVNYIIENTGSSDGSLRNLAAQFERLSDSTDVAANWVLSELSPELPSPITAGSNLGFNAKYVLNANADTGFVAPLPQLLFNDLRTPQYTDTTKLAAAFDSVRVIIPAKLRTDSLVLATINPPRVNENQSFDLRYYVTNTGLDTAKNIQILLTKNGADSIILAIPRVAPSSQELLTYNTVLDSAGTFSYFVKIESAIDATTGSQVEIEQPIDNAEVVFADVPALLNYANSIVAPDGALDGVVSIGQEFRIETMVTNSGTAPTGSGTIRLVVPVNYIILPENLQDSTQTISNNESIIWRVQAIDTTVDQLSFDALEFSLTDSLIDLNIAQASGIGTFDDTVLVRTITAVDISVIPRITSPAGAVDKVLSSGQVFTFTADIRFNSAVADSGRYAEILFSDTSYGVANSRKSLTNGVDQISVSWSVTAPTTDLSTQDTIWVQVDAFDRNSNRDTTIISETDSGIVRTINISNLAINAVITSPPGAQNTVLSTGQTFIARISVSNSGEADIIESTGEITVGLNNGLTFTETGNDTLFIPNFSTNTAYDREVNVPLSGLDEAQVSAEITTRPHDENTNAETNVSVPASNIDLNVVTRAELQVIAAMPDSIVKGIDQEFDIHALVAKSGVAQIDSGYLRLDLGNTNITTTEPLKKAFTLGDTVSWHVTSSTKEVAKVYIYADTTTTGGPFDENDGQYAFRTPESQVDSITFDIRGIQDPEITLVNFVDGATDSLAVTTGQDSIQITATVNFDELVDIDRRIQMVLPDGDGYTTNDPGLTKILEGTSDSSYTEVWNIVAPQNPVDWRVLELIATGSASVNPLLGALSDTASTLRIKTVQRARVILSVKIIDPAGSVDGVVSEGQEFTIQTLVRNDSSTALTVPGDSGFVSVDGFSSLLQLRDAATKKYAIDQPVNWIFDVGSIQGKQSSAQSDEMFRQIKDLRTQIGLLSATTQDIDLAEIHDQLSATIEELVVFTLDPATVPRDEFSLKPATTDNSPAALPVTVISRGAIEITATDYQDTVSSGQVFIFKAYFKDSLNVINAFATLSLPQGFTTAAPTLSLADSLTWAVQAPTGLTSPLETQFTVLAIGDDRNDGSPVQSNLVIENVRVEPRAKIILTKTIVDPSSAENGFVSIGERIVVTTKIVTDTSLTGMAGITGEGLIRLIKPDDFKLIGDDLRSAAVDSVIEWELEAPPTTSNAQTITFILDTLPEDINSGRDVFVDGSERIASFAVSVRQNVIIVEKTDESDSLAQSFRRGEENVALIAFEIRNPGNPESGAGIVNIDSVLLRFSDAATGDTLNSPALHDMLESINLVNWAEYKHRMAALAKPRADFGTLEISETEKNPIWFDLIDQLNDDNLQLEPGEKDTIVVLANLKSNATNRSFTVELVDIYAYDVKAGIHLRIEDSNGNLLGASDEFVSNRLTVIPDDPKETFRNYPNPFGRDYDETTIIFFLENDSEVKLRIFTLTGALVRSWQFDNLQAGLIDGQVKWDGKNDRDVRVLNGVYLCQIMITPKNGAAGQTYMTKIAYIK